MMVLECMSTYFVPIVWGSVYLGSGGPVRGTRNHVDIIKHMADMGKLS
jgi:hypothetical protein